VADFWQAEGWQVFVQPTQAPGHATELAKQAAANGHRLVLAAGGDGTLGEVTNGLAGTDTVLAPLPVGTANSFAKELGLPLPSIVDKLRLLEAAKLLAQGRVYRMDLGYTPGVGGNGRYWLLWSGTGVDGFLVHELEPRPRWSKRLGPFGYMLLGFAAMPKYPNMHATVFVDDKKFTGDFVLISISNCRMYGGEVILNPTGVLNDGLMEVWMFRGKGMQRLIQVLFETMRSKHTEDDDVIMARGRHIRIETEPVIGCHADGDPADFTPLECEVKPGALRILVPPTAPADMFVGPGEPLI